MLLSVICLVIGSSETHPLMLFFWDVNFPFARRWIYNDGYSHFVSPELCILESEMIRKITCVHGGFFCWYGIEVVQNLR
jgi:hypothetical protein